MKNICASLKKVVWIWPKDLENWLKSTVTFVHTTTSTIEWDLSLKTSTMKKHLDKLRSWERSMDLKLLILNLWMLSSNKSLNWKSEFLVSNLSQWYSKSQEESTSLSWNNLTLVSDKVNSLLRSKPNFKTNFSINFMLRINFIQFHKPFIKISKKHWF